MTPMPVSVRCCDCRWVGFDDQLAETREGPTTVERCPKCASARIDNLSVSPATRTARDEQDEGF